MLRESVMSCAWLTCAVLFGMCALAVVPAPGAQPPADPEGTWTGHIALPNGRLEVTVTLQRDDAGGWAGTVDIPAQGARGLPLGGIALDGRALSFRLLAGQGNPTMAGRISDDGQRVEGTFTQAGNALPFELMRGGTPAAAAAPPTSPVSWPGEAVRLDTGTGVLHGTLRLPPGPGLHPVALLIAGSGPTDRHGNSALLPGRNDSLALLAEALAGEGIASVRYDKRGVAESQAAGVAESEMRFETGVDDAAAWLAWLRGDARFSTVTVVGHSEGSLVGMRAARRGDADAFVSVAGVAHRASDVIREQLRAQQAPAHLRDAAEEILKALEGGRTVDTVPPELAPLLRRSVQPYLMSWFQLDPAAELRALAMPVLIAQGTTDIQVPVAEAHALHAAKPDAALAVIDGMNHVLKLVPADMAQQQASYSDPTRPVAPALMVAIRDFVRSVARDRPRFTPD